MCSSCLGRKGIAILREEARGIIWLRLSSSLPHLGLTFFFQHNHWLSCFWYSLHRIVGKTLPSQCIMVFQGLFFITLGNLFLILIFFCVISYGSGLAEITINLIVKGYAGCSGVSRVFLQSLEGGKIRWSVKAKTWKHWFLLIGSIHKLTVFSIASAWVWGI